MNKIEKALAALRTAEANLHAAVAVTFPPETSVFWMRVGRGVPSKQTGVVLKTADRRVRVRNEVSDREMWLDVLKFTKDHGGGIA